jgi:hypothetical protein
MEKNKGPRINSRAPFREMRSCASRPAGVSALPGGAV